MKKKIICTVSFLLIFIMIMFRVHDIFSYKYSDGIYSLTSFYDLPKDSVDVLVLGSSHAFAGINPAVLWEDKGIASFDLCGSGQLMWNTYYYLKEALKTQKPKLVVLEAYKLVDDTVYSDDDANVIKNVSGLKLSREKIDALQASVPKERQIGLGMEYIQYHNRYKSLSSEDFLPNRGLGEYRSWKGYGLYYTMQPYEKQEISNDCGYTKLPPREEEYYRKIIELCTQENLPLLVVVNPFSSYDDWYQGLYNEAKRIAGEYEIPFVNLNEPENGLVMNWETDFADPGHLSYLGSERVSHYLAEYITNHYEIPNRKSEAQSKYDSWEDNAQTYRNNLWSNGLAEICDLNEYAQRLAGIPENYVIIISVKGQIDEADNAFTSLMDFWEIPYDQAYDDRAWVISEEGISCVTATPCNYFWSKRYESKELVVDANGIYFDGRTNYQKSKDCVNVVVFDELNCRVADAVEINAVNNGEIVR